MRFAHPEWLWLMLAAPLAILAYAAAFARASVRLARLGDRELVARMTATLAPGKRVARAVAIALALAALGLALARPQRSGRARLEPQRGLDLIVALDLSRSMLARDIYPSRLERAKIELGRLLDALAGDRVGLVAFAGETLTFPPTTDYAALKLFWRDLSPADMPVGGTAIGRALRASLDLLIRLRDKGGAARGQVILLLTDGEDTESEPQEIAAEVAKLGVRIYSIGIGSRSGELIPEIDENGQVTGYVKDKDGKLVTSRLGEDMLARLASVTAGEYLRADARRFGVEEVIAALAGLKRTESEARLVKHYDEIYEYALFPAFLLLIAEACAGERRRRRPA